MAGEVDAERPLSLPVSPTGALVIELRPFAPGLLPLSVRIPLSRGVPIISAPDPRISAAVWPGGVVEIELIPQRTPAPARLIARSGSVRFFWIDGSPPLLRCESPDSDHLYPLPGGALTPTLTPLPTALLFTGGLGSGEQYALLLAPDASSLLLSVAGRHIEPLNNGSSLRLMHSFGDTVGHAALETWTASPAGWQLASSEAMWEHGAPVRPATPESLALAAIEAAQLSRLPEAAVCFAPACPYANVLARAAEYDGCTPLRYALPTGESAVGLMRLKENVLHIIPAKYAAQPAAPGSACLLTGLEIDEKAQM